MTRIHRTFAMAAALGIALFFPPVLTPHCDTLGGPVIAEARVALATGDVSPLLKWVRPESEAEIRAAFAKTLSVRTQGGQARELADNYFFETLVRIHRQGEGAPYTGLKPAEAIESITVETDKALEAGAPDPLIERLQQDVAEGIRSRFARVLATKKHAKDGVAAGREYVQAYIEYTHYVEALHATAVGKETHQEAGLPSTHTD